MYFKPLSLGTIGFDAIDNMHVEIKGDNPSEKKQCVFVYSELTTARESVTPLVFDRDSKAGRRVGKV